MAVSTGTPSSAASLQGNAVLHSVRWLSPLVILEIVRIYYASTAVPTPIVGVVSAAAIVLIGALIATTFLRDLRLGYLMGLLLIANPYVAGLAAKPDETNLLVIVSGLFFLVLLKIAGESGKFDLSQSLSLAAAIIITSFVFDNAVILGFLSLLALSLYVSWAASADSGAAPRPATFSDLVVPFAKLSLGRVVLIGIASLLAFQWLSSYFSHIKTLHLVIFQMALGDSAMPSIAAFGLNSILWIAVAAGALGCANYLIAGKGENTPLRRALLFSLGAVAVIMLIGLADVAPTDATQVFPPEMLFASLYPVTFLLTAGLDNIVPRKWIERLSGSNP